MPSDRASQPRAVLSVPMRAECCKWGKEGGGELLVEHVLLNFIGHAGQSIVCTCIASCHCLLQHSHLRRCLDGAVAAEDGLP